ncbi:MAG: DNA repair protein RecN [Candidatus Limivivens sp.]|nr:DNA repair protein RecN [Candidatus Limivivens sp.]
MLLNIHVKNMALIQEADIDLQKGLNILTGETGAGKSIIIGSVNVALGAASFKGFAKEGADYALVELVFSADAPEQTARLQELDIPVDDGQIIISRKLVNGRSISKINGETVTVAALRRAAEILIDIHGQHEHQSLLSPKNHLVILDDFAGEEVKTLKERNGQLYQEYVHLKEKLEASVMEEGKRLKEMDFLRYEIDEIAGAALKEGEDERLEKKYRKMSNSRRIIEAVTEAYQATGNDYGGASDQIGRAARSLQSVSGCDPELVQLSETLAQIESLMNDFNRDAAEYMDSLTFDPEEMEQTEERLDLINRLKSKYGNSIPEILAYQKEKEQRLEELTDYESYRARLTKEYAASEEKLLENCRKLTGARKASCRALTEQITAALIDLNFLDVRFEIQFDELKKPGKDGMDEICFLISTNPGQPLRPLQETASGGELSRIMLAVKAVMADRDATGTLIFDEIDTGISGRTAQKVSEKLAVIAGNHQVICITHLAQIAAMADSHFVIEKNARNDTTVTTVRRLSDEESIQELARILGGAEITERVLENAREMKELAGRTKKY